MLEILEQREEFKGKSMLDVLLDARLVDGVRSSIDIFSGVDFELSFSFSVASLLVKVVRSGEGEKATELLYTLLRLQITSATNSSSSQLNGTASNPSQSILNLDALGYILVLAPHAFSTHTTSRFLQTLSLRLSPSPSEPPNPTNIYTTLSKVLRLDEERAFLSLAMLSGMAIAAPNEVELVVILTLIEGLGREFGNAGNHL